MIDLAVKKIQKKHSGYEKVSLHDMKRYHCMLSDTYLQQIIFLIEGCRKWRLCKKCVVRHLWNDNNGAEPHKQEVLRYNGAV